ncbi:hypothetical protein [Amycolatopsis panacis]|uniref:Uncharacterized protein n=1 Tax=Amycolatopsis panacis TaxID=2340917 RepID=A0A419IC26_9PSEU|nr:hypothetical protein [Amycolatopsis panacis]RJQ92389.1 hypothetical protein D5S19_01090 [Amycolatopsis panacis]
MTIDPAHTLSAEVLRDLARTCRAEYLAHATRHPDDPDTVVPAGWYVHAGESYADGGSQLTLHIENAHDAEGNDLAEHVAAFLVAALKTTAHATQTPAEPTEDAAEPTGTLEQQFADALGAAFPKDLHEIASSDAYGALKYKTLQRCQDTGETPRQILAGLSPSDRAFVARANDPAAFLASRVAD